jgi:hypothetical protein
MAYDNKAMEALGRLMKVFDKKIKRKSFYCRRSGAGSTAATSKRASSVPASCV